MEVHSGFKIRLNRFTARTVRERSTELYGRKTKFRSISFKGVVTGFTPFAQTSGVQEDFEGRIGLFQLDTHYARSHWIVKEDEYFSFITKLPDQEHRIFAVKILVGNRQVPFPRIRVLNDSERVIGHRTVRGSSIADREIVG